MSLYLSALGRQINFQTEPHLLKSLQSSTTNLNKHRQQYKDYLRLLIEPNSKKGQIKKLRPFAKSKTSAKRLPKLDLTSVSKLYNSQTRLDSTGKPPPSTKQFYVSNQQFTYSHSARHHKQKQYRKSVQTQHGSPNLSMRAFFTKDQTPFNHVRKQIRTIIGEQVKSIQQQQKDEKDSLKVRTMKNITMSIPNLGELMVKKSMQEVIKKTDAIQKNMSFSNITRRKRKLHSMDLDRSNYKRQLTQIRQTMEFLQHKKRTNHRAQTFQHQTLVKEVMNQYKFKNLSKKQLWKKIKDRLKFDVQQDRFKKVEKLVEGDQNNLQKQMYDIIRSLNLKVDLTKAIKKKKKFGTFRQEKKKKKKSKKLKRLNLLWKVKTFVKLKKINILSMEKEKRKKVNKEKWGRRKSKTIIYKDIKTNGKFSRSKVKPNSNIFTFRRRELKLMPIRNKKKVSWKKGINNFLEK